LAGNDRKAKAKEISICGRLLQEKEEQFS